MKTIFTCHVLLLFILSNMAMGQEVISDTDSVAFMEFSSDAETDDSIDSIQTTSDTSKEIYSGRSSYSSNDLRNGQESSYKNSAYSKAVITSPEAKKSLLSSSNKLLIGYTYNRYGELVSPKGYGIQVVAFCNFKNLQKYLRLFVDKEMYIQVIDYTNHTVPLYRVIIGANEDKELIEKEISIFNNAGVNAVLRKHSAANYEAYHYTNNNH